MQIPWIDWFQALFSFANTDSVINGWLTLTALVFAVGLFFSLVGLLGHKRDLTELTRRLRQPDFDPDTLRLAPMTVWNTRLRRGYLTSAVLAALAEWDASIVAGTSPARSTADVRDMLAWSTLQSRFAHEPAIKVTPALLVGLGILGTFVGLTQGISQLTTQLAVDPNNLNAALGGLLGGMTLAFFSSIMGIALSLIFQGWATIRLRTAESNHNALVGLLADRFPLLSPERLQALWFQTATEHADTGTQLNRLITQQTIQITELGRQTATSQILLLVGLEKLGTSFETALASRVELPLRDLQATFQEEQQRGWNQVATTLQDGIKELTAEEFRRLREVLESIIALHERETEARTEGVACLERATNAAETMVASFTQSAASFQELAGGLIEWRDGVSQNAQQQREHLELLREGLRDLADAFWTFQEVTQAKDTAFREEWQRSLEQSREHFQSQLEGLNEQFTIIREEAETRDRQFAQIVADGLAQLRDAQEEATRAFARDLQEPLRQVGLEFSGALQGALSELADGLKTGAQTLDENLREIRNATQDMSDSIEAMSAKLLAQQTAGAQELRALQAAISSSETALKKLSSQLVDATMGIDKELRIGIVNFRTEVDSLLGTATRHLGQVLSELQEATEPLPATVGEFHRSSLEMIGDLRELLATSRSGNGALPGAGEQS